MPSATAMERGRRASPADVTGCRAARSSVVLPACRRAQLDRKGCRRGSTTVGGTPHGSVRRIAAPLGRVRSAAGGCRQVNPPATAQAPQGTRALPLLRESRSLAPPNREGAMRFRLRLLVLVLGLQGATPGVAGWFGGTERGSCGFCCAVYPPGWRGMCVRRCASERRFLPAWQRRDMPCECGLNWRREWTCRRR